MKKIISLILAVLMIFSVTAVAAFAEDEARKPIKVTFVYDIADSNGIAVGTTKVIYVDYEEDFTSKAPKDTYISDGYKYYITGWETAQYGVPGTVYEKLPKIAQNDLITDITFKACYSVEKFTAGGVIEDVAGDIFGDSTLNFFSYIMEQLKTWFAQFILFLRNFA